MCVCLPFGLEAFPSPLLPAQPVTCWVAGHSCPSVPAPDLVGPFHMLLFLDFSCCSHWPWSRMFVFCPMSASPGRQHLCPGNRSWLCPPPIEFIITVFDLPFLLTFIFRLNRCSFSPLIVWPCSPRSHLFPPSRCPLFQKPHSLFQNPILCSKTPFPVPPAQLLLCPCVVLHPGAVCSPHP